MNRRAQPSTAQHCLSQQGLIQQDLNPHRFIQYFLGLDLVEFCYVSV